ncbi:60S ribosomal protein L35 [Blastocystis sp. subtype 4]|uniref:60S ribosomal protein L35 n=1 Tax=Blastocystis sp. subtype 4 TaxID=944170 RepID=UPI000711CD52|nr:60S ribosomal protein L35 [Blastocystis sp. subtype 4]KNB46704.1 60S ribosomal protein L35 [Blastocystis sp. subtype 4]|eukprot:XP_014530147.1 60S ribosomal protein L35 [Blastocystis sp. subtype 4]
MSYTPSRLHVKGAILGYRRSKVAQYENQSLIKIEGVNTAKDAEFYFGKRVAYVYKAETMKNGSHYRCIWGKVAKAHGTNGVVRVFFRHNLPPQSMGKTVRVMLYPSRV